MRKEDKKAKNSELTRREFIRIAGIGVVCAGGGFALGKSLSKEEESDVIPVYKSLPAYRTKDIWKIEIDEGDTAFTGNPERPSEKCTGCMSCMAVCSLCKEGVVSPELSGIKVYHYTNEWVLKATEKIYTHSICRQCPGLPPCDEICPVHAHYRDERTGAVLIDHNNCIRCGACVEACPYNACWYSPERDKIIKCDYCYGNSDGPQCIKNCTSKILKLRAVI